MIYLANPSFRAERDSEAKHSRLNSADGPGLESLKGCDAARARVCYSVCGNTTVGFRVDLAAPPPRLWKRVTYKCISCAKGVFSSAALPAYDAAPRS
jgi:hypothetical protein